MNDRLNQLALFVRTIDTGSFSKTAREFGLSQPSVSRAVATLEARLGVTLLRRATRRVSATDVGLALAERARDALAAIDDAENAARGADRLTGVLRVSLPTAFGVRMIVPLLPGFLALQPGLRVELYPDSTGFRKCLTEPGAKDSNGRRESRRQLPQQRRTERTVQDRSRRPRRASCRPAGERAAPA